jgi:Protein of unknown function (DUF2568)
MAQAWKWSNLLLVFALELVAIVAFGIWGWHAGGSRTVRVLLAAGLPVVAAVLWGLFAARHPRYDVPALRLLVKVVVLGGAAVALWASGYHTVAIVYAVVLVANLTAIRLGRLDADTEVRPSPPSSGRNRP